MRILHINCNYMTTVLHQTMTEHLTETGVHNRVFAPVYNAKLAVITPNDNVTVAECFNKWDRIHFGYKQHKIISAAEKCMNISQFDCLHAYTLFTDGNCAMKLSEKYNIPYVVAVRSTDLYDFLRLKPWLRKRAVQIMERASAVFFLSQRYLDDMFDRHVPKDKKEALRAKCCVVPNGIDDFWLNNIPQPHSAEQIDRIKNKKINIILAGRINKNKNQLALMEAVDKLNASGYEAKMLAVGNVEDEAVAEKLRANPNVTVEAAQKKDKLLLSYRENDIFVMPSFVETFGLVYVEAMSQGLPVVYSKSQGFDGQFPEGTVGYSVDPNNADDIAEKIKAVCENYETLATNGPELAKPFNWTAIANTYKEIYEKIVEN